MSTSNNAGRLIVIEGLDGSGKATQAKLLAQHLAGRGDHVLQTSFPDYESESSALVRLYLSGGAGNVSGVNVYAASSFYAADRYISYHTGWKKQWDLGHTIIADRYTTSNLVHQMSKLPQAEWDNYLSWLWDFEFNRMGLPQPDLVIYLDMPPESSRELLLRRYNGDESRVDAHESDIDYQTMCRQAALFASEKLSWKRIVCKSDVILSIDTIAQTIQNIVIADFNRL